MANITGRLEKDIQEDVVIPIARSPVLTNKMMIDRFGKNLNDLLNLRFGNSSLVNVDVSDPTIRTAFANNVVNNFRLDIIDPH